jgi:hypothetical protein
VAFPDTPLDAHVDLLIDGVWVDRSADVDLHGDERVEIQRGSRNAGSGLEPAACTLRLDNTDGAYSTLNPTSPDYGKLMLNNPARMRIGSDVRFIGEIPSWPPRWNRLNTQAWVTVNPVGSLQRLQNDDPLESAPLRYIPTTSPVAYWSMEGGRLIETAAPVVGAYALRPFDGTHPSGAVVGSPEWGRGELAPWLSPVVQRAGRSPMTILWAPVSMPSFAGTWTVDRMYAGGSDGDVSSVTDVNPSYLGGSLGWPQLSVFPDVHFVSVSFNGLPEVDMYVPPLFNGLAHHLRWTATQNGANVDWSVSFDGIVIGSGSIATYTLPAMTTIGLVGGGTNSAPFAEGHVGIWTTPPPIADAFAAAFGHTGESAGERVQRLCAQEQVPLGVVGDLSKTLPVGPQYAGKTLVELCEDAARVDDSRLYEPRQIVRTVGDFEDTSVQDWGGYGSVPPTVSNSTTRAHSGARSLLITWGAGGVLPLVQKFVPQTFVVGVTYTATAWAWVPTGGVDLIWALGGIGFGGVTSLRDQWQQISITFTATATDHQTQLWPNTVPAGGEQAWVDDVQIRTDERGLAFRTRESTENQTAVVALDYGDLTEPFEPEVDTRALVNRSVVTRTEGGTFTAELEEGPLSVQRPPLGAGRYSKPLEGPFADDVTAAERPGWEVHKGTTPGPRYTSVTVDLHANPTLIPTLSLVDIGDLVTIDNAPDYLPPGTIELIVEGITESWNDYEWTITLTASPGQPWRVGIVDDGTYGRADFDGAELAAAVTNSATTFEVAYTEDTVGTVDDAEFPFSVTAAGEEMTLTDIAPATIAFVAAGTAAHANNASVTPGLAGATGNLLLLFASTTLGAPSTPTGYTLLVDTTRSKLFAKIRASSESAPTVTFTGGGAASTNSAQIYAFSGRFQDAANLVANSAWQLNASAQNVAYPDLDVRVPNCLIVYAVAKDDDWTGAAGPGTEIGDTSSALGSDQGIAVYYQIQTTPAVIGMGSVTITGGASAISRGMVAAIRCDKQLWTVTRSVNGVVKSHTAGTAVSLTHPMIAGVGGVL